MCAYWLHETPGSVNAWGFDYNIRVLDVDEAQRMVLSHVRPVATVERPLGEAFDYALAEAIRCDLDDPPFDRSVMDGYAVRAADVVMVPTTLRVSGQIAAGAIPDTMVKSGEAVQINTGAPMPPGADAVVRVEETSPGPSADAVVIRQSVPAGQFVVSRGAYARAGQVVLERGALLTPVNIAVAATAGAAKVTVHRRPTAAVLTTGNELVDIDTTPTAAQIRNSNQYLLAALFHSAHMTPHLLGVARDDREHLRAKIRQGMASDILCITGGVSAGAFDYVPDVLREQGADFKLHKLAIRPGRPTIFATTPNGALIFALPGNPVSAFIAFELLVRPAIAALQGRRPPQPELFSATLNGPLPATANRRSYYPGFASADPHGHWAVKRLSWQGSGDAIGLAGANAMIMRPPQSPGVVDGDVVSVFLLDRNA